MAMVHMLMLRSVLREACLVVTERWGLGRGTLRSFVHHQSQIDNHFHVHVVNAEYQGLLGMIVGQAHLLDDIISLLELSSDGHSIPERMTLTHGLGDQHGVYEAVRGAAQPESND